MAKRILFWYPNIPAVVVSLLLITLISACNKNERIEHDSPFQNGDVIFQSIRSSQSDAIQLASHSKYSHCGIIFWEGDKCYVYEAFKNVRTTPIDKFLERSENHQYAVRRLKDAATLFSTNDKVNTFIRIYYKRFNGKPYDILYGASDDKIYCSELVWRLFKEAGDLDVGEWRLLRNFDLQNAVVQEQLQLTYGDHIPLDENIVSPEALYVSDKFITVIEEPSAAPQ